MNLYKYLYPEVCGHPSWEVAHTYILPEAPFIAQWACMKIMFNIGAMFPPYPLHCIVE